MSKEFLGKILVPEKKLEILEKLVENPDQYYSYRELARKVEASYGTVRTFLKELEEEKIVLAEEKSRTTLNSYNPENRHNQLILKLLRTRIEDMVDSAERAAEKIEEETEDATVILFGSVAKGTATEKSDIDLLILVPERKELEEHIRNKIARIEKKTRYSISPMIIEKERFEEELENGERFAEEVRNTGKTLRGISPWKKNHSKKPRNTSESRKKV